MSIQSKALGAPGLRLWGIKYQLNLQQERFVESYVEHFDLRRAAMDAGVSPQNAKAIGFKFLQMVKIQRAIKSQTTELKSRAEEYRDALLAEILAIAMADVTDLFDENGRLKPIAEWPREWSSGSAGRVEVTYAPADTTKVPVSVTVKGANKLNALWKLFRYFSLGGAPGNRELEMAAIEKAHAQLRGKGRGSV